MLLVVVSGGRELADLGTGLCQISKSEFDFFFCHGLQLPSPEHRGPAHAGRTCAEGTAGVLVAEIFFFLTTSTSGYALSILAANSPVLSIGVQLTLDGRVQRGLRGCWSPKSSFLTTSTSGYALSLGFVLRSMVYVVVLQVLLRLQDLSCAPSDIRVTVASLQPHRVCWLGTWVLAAAGGLGFLVTVPTACLRHSRTYVTSVSLH